MSSITRPYKPVEGKATFLWFTPVFPAPTNVIYNMVDLQYLVYRNKLMKEGCLGSGFPELEFNMGILVHEICKGRTLRRMVVKEARVARESWVRM